jgi:tetratricopeptide (TPR) repeat protein
MAIANRIPPESSPAPVLNDLFRAYQGTIIILRGWDEPEECMPLVKRLIPIAEALQQGDPANQAYRTTLMATYKLAGSVASDRGDWSYAVSAIEKEFQLKADAPLTVYAWQTLGREKLSLAFIQSALKNSDAANRNKREALDAFQNERKLALSASAGAGTESSNLASRATASNWIAATYESLGDLRAAATYHEESSSEAAAASDADPGNADRREVMLDRRGLAVRARWLLGGSDATFPTIPRLGGSV